MHTQTYTPPVDALLTYHILETGKSPEYPNYVELGIGHQDIPDLIRMATDRQLTSEEADDLEFAAPVYAIHILEELHAEEAIEPLLSLFDNTDDDWIEIELLSFYAKFGSRAISGIREYLMNPSNNNEDAASFASNVLGRIGVTHPEERAECIEALAQRLSIYKADEYELNGFLIGDLVGLKAVEKAPLIEQVFAADAVDKSIAGDWEDVQVDLGLKEKRETPRTYSSFLDIPTLEGSERPRLDSASQVMPYVPSTSSSLTTPKTANKSDSKKKTKNKMAKASRKKNRRK